MGSCTVVEGGGRGNRGDGGRGRQLWNFALRGMKTELGCLVGYNALRRWPWQGKAVQCSADCVGGRCGGIAGQRAVIVVVGVTDAADYVGDDDAGPEGGGGLLREDEERLEMELKWTSCALEACEHSRSQYASRRTRSVQLKQPIHQVESVILASFSLTTTTTSRSPPLLSPISSFSFLEDSQTSLFISTHDDSEKASWHCEDSRTRF
jgi:hypothetical protein